MTWAKRLKRVFKIDIETCEHFGGAMKVIASIEDPAVIKQIRKIPKFLQRCSIDTIFDEALCGGFAGRRAHEAIDCFRRKQSRSLRLIGDPIWEEQLQFEFGHVCAT